MFCTECGTKLTESSKYCTNCGAKLESEPSSVAAPPVSNAETSTKGFDITKKAKTPTFKIAVLIASVVVFALLALLVYQVVSNSGKNYVYTSLLKSAKAYQKEADVFVNNNAVLSQIKENFKKSYSYVIKTDDFKVTVNDDKKSKVLEINATARNLPIAIKTFFATDKLIVGAQSIAYFEANTKNLGDDVEQFLGSAHSLLGINIGDEVYDFLNKTDLSYNAVSSLNIGKMFTMSKDGYSNYVNLLKILVDQSEYSKVKSTIKIGGKDVKTTRIALTADHKVMSEWLLKSVIPTLSADKQLESNYNAAMPFSGNLVSWNEVIKELKRQSESLIYLMEDEEITIELSADIHKGVIVSIELNTLDTVGDSINTIRLSALGEKYRLNNIEFTMDKIVISAVGEHIGNELLSSVITSTDGYLKEKLIVEWDTKETSNNLRLKLDSVILRMTFTKDGTTVRAESKDNFFAFSWTLGLLESTISTPAKTTPIKDTSLMELYLNYNDVLDSVFN